MMGSAGFSPAKPENKIAKGTKTMKLTKIISGGQTGADQGGLEGAFVANLDTGGWMPKGWKTESGPRPQYGPFYGMRELDGGYAERTLKNIMDSDGTVVFGNPMSSGSQLTMRRCQECNKPVVHVPFPFLDRASHLNMVRTWIEVYGIAILNVAGNRESVNPNIKEAVQLFIVDLVTGGLTPTP